MVSGLPIPVDILDWLVPSLLGIQLVVRMGFFLLAFLLQRLCLVIQLHWCYLLHLCRILVALTGRWPFHSFSLVCAIFQSHILKVRALPLLPAVIFFVVTSNIVD